MLLEFRNMDSGNKGCLDLDDVGLERLKRDIHNELATYTPRQLAVFFSRGSEDERMLYRRYIRTTAQEVEKEFREHLRDPFLGEREGDDFQ